MLYQSVRESAAFFQKKKKSKQTKQDKLVFRWKFLVLGLGVIVVILVGICSELIKSVSNMRKVPINTTFLYRLLPVSSFFDGNLQTLKYFIAGLGASSDIKFDNSTMLFTGFNTSGQFISKVIEEKQNILYLFQLDEDSTIHKFGMVLHQNFPNINYEDENSNAYVSDSRDALTSIIFSLTSNHSVKLDKTDNCFIYKYTNKNKQLSFVQLLHFNSSQQSKISVNAQKLKCFTTKTKQEQVEQESLRIIKEVIGVQLKVGQTKILNILSMEIHQLEMNYEIVLNDGKINNQIVEMLRNFLNNRNN